MIAREIKIPSMGDLFEVRQGHAVPIKITISGEANKLRWRSVATEKERQFTFPSGETLTIKEPQWVAFSDSGGIRLLDAKENCWYIKPSEGWHIRWRVKEGEPHFSF